MQEVLKKNIEQRNKQLEESNEWKVTYGKMANIILDNRAILKKLWKECRGLEYLDFKLMEVSVTPPTLFKITLSYMGQPVADIQITKEEQIYISTGAYNDTNKKNFKCSIQLDGEEWNSQKATEFIEYFKGDIKPSGKINEITLKEKLLLDEFSIKTSTDKLMTGIQPVKIENLTYSLPIFTGNVEDLGAEPINILTRTKVRRLTIIEVMKAEDTEDTVINRATEKAVFLLNLLKAENVGDQWYKVMGFHGRIPMCGNTVKVVIATDQATNYKEHEPYSIEVECDKIEYHYMHYATDKDMTKIKKIKSSLNEKV